MMTQLQYGKDIELPRAIFRQVGWLGHNDKKFYYLQDNHTCRRNNPGGYSPIWEQVGSRDSEGIRND